MVLADKGRDELIAMKRISFSDKTTTSLTFTTPAHAGKAILNVLLVSDCYLGLDFQQELVYVVQ